MGDSQYVLYADDTSIVYLGDNLSDLVAHVNQKLSLVAEWCKFNKLALNPEKSEFMLITGRRLGEAPHIHVNGSPVKHVNCTKYLGVFIGSHLKFHSHIEYIENKLCRFSGISYKLRHHFNKSTALKFYYSCVYSSISYFLSVWGGVSLCTHRCDRIVRLQRRIVNNLFSQYFNHDPDANVFKNMKLLKFIS